MKGHMIEPLVRRSGGTLNPSDEEIEELMTWFFGLCQITEEEAATHQPPPLPELTMEAWQAFPLNDHPSFAYWSNSDIQEVLRYWLLNCPFYQAQIDLTKKHNIAFNPREHYDAAFTEESEELDPANPYTLSDGFQVVDWLFAACEITP